MHQGIPEGSILGPILFVLYINDLFRVCKNLRAILFADDTTFSYGNSSLNSCMHVIYNDCNSIMEWFRVNLLLLNIKKTKYTSFKFKKELMLLYDMVLNDTIIQRVNSIKFVGRLINSPLSWHEHIML